MPFHQPNNEMTWMKEGRRLATDEGTLLSTVSLAAVDDGVSCTAPCLSYGAAL